MSVMSCEPLKLRNTLQFRQPSSVHQEETCQMIQGCHFNVNTVTSRSLYIAQKGTMKNSCHLTQTIKLLLVCSGTRMFSSNV